MGNLTIPQLQIALFGKKKLPDIFINTNAMTRIIKFEKNGCAPCAQVSAFLDNKGIRYESVNPFDQPDLAARLRVRTVPTVIVMNGEREHRRIIGFKPEELASIGQ